MKLTDVIYRAFKAYRKNTKDSRECEQERNYIRSSNIEKDSIKFISYDINIDLDWVETIEEGLVFVEKCVREEHQFIRVNGEVVKIEKVKRVSKDSVRHLAKHSNLIRRDTGEDVIPDELFMTEKLSDYAVYENKFLYLLLCYLRDFILLRYNNIVEYSNKYHGKMQMEKAVNYQDKKLTYKVDLDEQIDNDEYRIKNNPNKDIIERIKNLLSTVMYLLSTNLMVEVSKVPIIKPPIVKTNVLRMNQNFKRAVELYDYVTTYDKDGYVIDEKIKNISPFSKEISDEFAETIALHSFLTYEYNNGLQKELKANYDAEEDRRKEVERERYQQQLKLLRKKVNDSGMSMEEYMLMLELRNKQLEKDSQQLVKANEEIRNLNLIIDELRNTISDHEKQIRELNGVITEKNIEIESLINKYTEEINELQTQHQLEIEALKADCDNKLNELEAQHQANIAELNANFAQQIEEIRERHEEELQQREQEKKELIASFEAKIDSINSDHAIAINAISERLTSANATISEKEKLIKDFEDLVQLYNDEKLVLLAELNGIRQGKGKNGLEEDFTSEERFKELEEELKAFKKVFNKQWQKTKKRIYKEVKAQVFAKLKKGNK